MESRKLESNSENGAVASDNFALPAGGIRRPHPRPDIWGARVRECVVVTRHGPPREVSRIGTLILKMKPLQFR